MAAERPEFEREGSPRPARVPPHNLQAEESLLGAMLLSKDAIASAVEAVGVDDFYKPAHAHIFEAITSLYGAGEPADPVTVAEELRRAGPLDAVGGQAELAHGRGRSAEHGQGAEPRHAHSDARWLDDDG